MYDCKKACTIYLVSHVNDAGSSCRFKFLAQHDSAQLTGSSLRERTSEFQALHDCMCALRLSQAYEGVEASPVHELMINAETVRPVFELPAIASLCDLQCLCFHD